MQQEGYISQYKKNRFIESFILSDFQEKSLKINELNELIDFLKKELNKLYFATGWSSFFYPFKKAVKTIIFINGFIVESNNFIGKDPQNKYKEWFELSEDLGKILDFLSDNHIFQFKFEKLLKEETCETNKQILNVWLSTFFDKDVERSQKKEYKSLKSLLDEKIETFITNGEDRGLIYIAPHQKYMLKGLSQNSLLMGKEQAKEKMKDGWVFITEDITTELLLGEAKVRSFRKKLYQSYQKNTTETNSTFNNDKVLRNIISIKQQIAHIHKQENYAKLVLSNYVLNTPDKAYTYLNEIEKEIIPLIDNLGEEITNKAKQDGIKKLKNWDIPYYIEQIKKENKKINKEEFEDYFIFDSVLKNFLAFLRKEFKLNITEVKNEVINNNELITYHIYDEKTKNEGYFLFSPFNNENKSSPSQTELCGNEKISERNYFPSVEYITLQLEKDDELQKMSFYDMIVLLHEFGHALHSFYGNRKDTYLNESLISWDLIELPSQFIEHLIYDINFMQKLSCHYETGKKIGKKLLKETIRIEQYFKPYETYKDIKKYNAQLWLYENFKQYSQKSPHEIVNEIIGHNGLIYNITKDDFMLYNDHLKDYAPSGYVYLYSAKIAHNLLKNNKSNMKEIFTKVFNSDKINKVESRLNEIVDLNNIDMIDFFKKGWSIKLYGE